MKKQPSPKHELPIWGNNKSTNQKCKYCGCTQERACRGGCYWIYENVCSECEEKFNNDPKNKQANKNVSKLIKTLMKKEDQKPKENPASEQRRHHIHFQLKKHGISIDPEKRTISLSDEMKEKLTKQQKAWIDELVIKFKYDTQTAIHIQPQIKTTMENNKTNFFSSILPYLEHAGMRIVIDNEGGKLSVSILPQTKKENAPFRITPFNAQGTAAEMDEGILAQLAKAYEKLEEAGLKTNAEDFAEGIEVRNKPKATAKPTKSPSGTTASKKAPEKKAAPAKKTIKDQVLEALKKDNTSKAQTLVQKADKGGGLPKDQVEELVALVDKALASKYYSDAEQKQLKTRLDSMRTESEGEEKTLRQLKDGASDPAKQKQYDAMLKDPIKRLQAINKAMDLLDKKKLGLQGKKLTPIAQLIKNPIA